MLDPAMRCRRCGCVLCHHPMAILELIPDDHAARIRARYAIGKKFDLEGHDTADYFTDPPATLL